MQLPAASFDSETVTLMGRVCDDAWRKVQSEFAMPSDVSDVRSMLALRILTAVANGERDPERLKTLALQTLDA